MQLNTLSPAPGSTKVRKRVGRGIGSGWGKTCGTGHKGQKSRTGGTVRPGFEGGQMPLQMRLPKYGFSSRIGRKTADVRTSELNLVKADLITVEALRKANLITANITRVKVMLSGDVTKAVTVEGLGVTKGARAAIEAAGGKVIEAAPVEKKSGKLVKKLAKADTEIETKKAARKEAKAEAEEKSAEESSNDSDEATAE
jgi:large subunit ribosomal protein L15